MQHCACSGWLFKRGTSTLEDVAAGDEQKGRPASQREIKRAWVLSALENEEFKQFGLHNYPEVMNNKLKEHIFKVSAWTRIN